MIFAWEPSKWSSSLLLPLLALALLGCKGKAEVPDPQCLDQGHDETIEQLMVQREQAGEPEKDFATRVLPTKRDGKWISDWCGVWKGYAASVGCWPTTDALVGRGDAMAMCNRVRDDVAESLTHKLGDFREAVRDYRLAIALGDRTGQPMTAEQRRDTDAKLACLEQFAANPQPEQPPCPLVADALRDSRITTASGSQP